ncbi:MAG: TolC family protein [Phycisphaerales bacterium]
MSGNLDLKLATVRIREARAARSFASAASGPTVDANAGYLRSRPSETSGTAPSTVRGGDGQDLFTAGLDAAWEFDVFGGVRRSVEAADADIGAAVWNRRNITVSLLAEIALNYIDLRTAQQRIAATRGNVDTQSKTVDLATNRFTTGLDSEIDSTRARSQRAATRSLIPALETQARQAIYRLSVLTGQNPGALVAELDPTGPIPAITAGSSVPISAPTDVLRRRPDLRQAERELAGATARIGVATADLYPRFTLNGNIGFSTAHLEHWPEARSLFWGIGPGVSWNLFDGGAIRANIAVTEARTEQAFINYQGTLLNALRETDSAAIAFIKNQQRAADLTEAVQQQQRAVELANQLFSKQLTNFLTVLDSQRRLFELQDELVASQGDVGTSLVSLYKALGGGWEGSDEVLDAPPGQQPAVNPAPVTPPPAAPVVPGQAPTTSPQANPTPAQQTPPSQPAGTPPAQQHY